MQQGEGERGRENKTKKGNARLTVAKHVSCSVYFGIMVHESTRELSTSACQTGLDAKVPMLIAW